MMKEGAVVAAPSHLSTGWPSLAPHGGYGIKPEISFEGTDFGPGTSCSIRAVTGSTKPFDKRMSLLKNRVSGGKQFGWGGYPGA
jgi:hypothetical protein